MTQSTIESPALPPAKTDPAPAPRRGRWRRRFAKLAMGLVVLIIVIAVAVEVVFHTNLPRDIVLRQVQQQLGLRLEADSLSTGWLGHTTLRNVALSLPLADKAFFTTPRLSVDHTSIFGLLLTRSVALKAVALEKPTLNVVQCMDGQWNLAEVGQLVARAAGGKSATDKEKSSGLPQLPRLTISDMAVHIVNQAGQATDLTAIQVRGEPKNPLLYQYDVAVPPPPNDPAGPKLQLTGRVAPGGAWTHEVDVALANAAAFAKPWLSGTVPAVAANLRWRGEVQDGALHGRLDILQAAVDQMRASGTLHVQQQAGAIVVQPDALLVQTGQPVLDQLRLASGRIIVQGTTFRAEDLILGALDGLAKVDGSYDTAASAGTLTARWDRLLIGTTMAHDGAIQASIRTPLPGQPEVHVELNSNGYRLDAKADEPAGVWEAKLAVDGKGTSWNIVDWRVSAPRLAYLGSQPIGLDGFTAVLAQRPKEIRFSTVSVPNRQVKQAEAVYNLENNNWSAKLSVLDAVAPLPWGGTTSVALALSAAGNPAQATLEDLYVRGAEAEMTATGQYVFNQPKPVDLQVKVDHIPPRYTEQDQPPIRGFLRGQARLTGTLVPLHLEADGDIRARNLVIADRPVGDISAKLKTATIVANRFLLETEQVKLLGGQWSLTAQFPDQSGVLGAELRVVDLPLEQLGALAKQKDVKGKADGLWRLTIPRPEIAAVSVDGTLVARDLAAAGFTADRVQATTKLAQGTLRVDPIVATKRAVVATTQGATQPAASQPSFGEGTARASVELDLQEMSRAVVSADVAKWPVVTTEAFQANASAQLKEFIVYLPGKPKRDPMRGRVEYDLDKVRAEGAVNVQADMMLKGQHFGSAALAANVKGRVVDVGEIRVDTLQGKGGGTARVDLDRPTLSRASVTWQDVDAAEVIDYFPDKERLIGLEGYFDGELEVAPADGTRPLEPLAIHIRVQPRQARYRSAHIDEIVVNAFTDLQKRFVLQSLEQPMKVGSKVGLKEPEKTWHDQASSLKLAGGTVAVWGRVTRHEPIRRPNLPDQRDRVPTWIALLEVDYKDLNLNQIVQAADPTAEPMIGSLAGHFRVGGSTRVEPRKADERAGPPPDPFEQIIKRVTASGDVKITKSDLVNLDMISALYNLMNLGGMDGPTGEGSASFRMENGTFSLNQMKYFNRGTEIRAAATITDIWKMPAAPLSGSAVGTARPLKNLKIPFMDVMSLDQILTLVQSNATSIRLGGLVNDPKIIPATFADLGGGLKALFASDVSSQVQGSASE